jgi:dTDP-4-dehydrorhamnose reductase
VIGVVVLGAKGMLGTDLVATAPDDVRVDAFGRSDLDITDPTAVARVLDKSAPDWVVNASAYTQVDKAETEFDRALAVNAAAVGRLGEICASRFARVVHFSTDYVFAGTGTRPYAENDPTDPLNAYGKSKLDGERALAVSGVHALVLRTQWLYGVHGKSFPRTMWDRATSGAPTRVVTDQMGRPTYTLDLARATWDLVRKNAKGVYHVANAGEPASWFDVASVVFEAAGASRLLSGCTTADYPTAARRPSYSVLDTTRLAREAGIELRPWRIALAEFLDLLRRAHRSPEGARIVTR